MTQGSGAGEGKDGGGKMSPVKYAHGEIVSTGQIR